MRNTLLRTVGFGLLAVGSVQAATNIIDFNTNPLPGPPPALYRDIGAGEWRPSGGASGGAADGYLKVTDAAGGQVTKLVFKDLEPGLVVKSFIFECDLRIGGGTARPADGFSINYVDVNDPMITNADAGTATDIGDYSGTDNETSLPEEGGRTGLGIGFDTWESAAIGGVPDVVGISIRVGGALITQLPVPLQPGNVFPGGTYNEVPNRNLATNNANYAFSMQTGALSSKDLNADGVVDAADANAAQPAFGDPAWGDWIENLKWEKFRAEVTEDGKVKISWKGVELTPAGGLQTSYSPIPGRLVFGGRTGGAWEVHHVDNIRLVTIPADFLIIGSATGNPIGFSITTSDSGPAIADTNTIALKLNNTTVTPSTVSKTGGLTTITYHNIAAPLTVGSTNTVDITISDTRALPVSGTKTFVVPAYQTLPASLAVTGVDTAQAGFNVRWHQVEMPALSALENTVARAEQQLYGMRGANAFAIASEAVTDVINYDQAAGIAGNWNANTSAGFEYTDKQIPLANPANTDNMAAEIETYVNFTEPGVYNLIFNSDDGFRTTIGGNVSEVFTSFMVSQFDGGRGAVDTVATLLVPTAGFYPVRSVWFEGGGGGNLEWVAERTVPNATGRALINDPLKPASIKAYRARTGTTPAAVTFTHPFRNSGSPYQPTITLTAELEDGSTPVDQNSIVMKLDGVVVTPVKATAGNKTTLTYDPPTNLAAGTHTNEIAFTAGAQQYAGINTFTVRSVISVPPSLALPASAVVTANVGFLVKTLQQANGESMANDTYRGLVHAANLIGQSNVADLALFTGPSGYYVETSLINYDQAAGAAVGFFNANSLYADVNVPGIPGTTASTDNFVQEILTVLDLPAGIIAMNVNSDDGFFLDIGNPLESFGLATRVGEFSGGRGSGGGIGDGTTFYFQVAQAGLYPARMVWYEGGGGANMEWSSIGIDASGSGGALTTYKLINDTSAAGHIKAYQYPLTSAGAPYVESFTPARNGRGDRAGANTPIKAVIVDGVNPVVPTTVSLMLDSTAVTLPVGAVTKTGNKTTLNYQPAAAFAAGSTHAVALTFGDRTVNWSFTVNASNINTASFYIEAEDFNTGSGQSQPAASVMPYAGGAYAGLNSTADVDYSRANEDSSPIYRIGEEPSVPMDRTGDRDRGLGEIVVNYKIGWIGDGQWYNYTRTFPAGTYNVFAGLSHGDAPTSATRIRGTLQRVTSNPALPGQTVVDLGTFNGPSTGGWGLNALVPLVDTNTTPATVVALSLSGTDTLRMALGNGDFDFLLFVPPGVPGIQITSINITGGNVTVNWTGGGTLFSAPSLNTLPATWTTTGDSDGSFTAPVGTGNLYFRVQGP